MPLWLVIPLLLVALLGCPLMMWVAGRVTGRKMDCMSCLPGGHRHEDEASVEKRKAALDSEIVRLKKEIGQEQGLGR